MILIHLPYQYPHEYRYLITNEQSDNASNIIDTANSPISNSALIPTDIAIHTTQII